MLRLHLTVVRLARGFAVIGGTVLSVLVLITCLSIAGRALNGALATDLAMSIAPGLAQGLIDAGIGAIPGDFELVEAGMAFCIFAFLPFCQVTAGHASVDVFTDALPMRAKRGLIFLTETLFAVVLVTIAVQLYAALERNMQSGQTTMLLQFPIWWSYAASLAGAAAAAAAGVYMALLRLYEATTGHAVIGAAGRPA